MDVRVDALDRPARSGTERDDQRPSSARIRASARGRSVVARPRRALGAEAGDSSSCTRTRRTRSSTAPRSPEELAARAAELGYDALALTDHDGRLRLARVRARGEALRRRAPITGAEVTLDATAPTSRCSCETPRAATRTSAGSSPARTPHPRRRDGSASRCRRGSTDAARRARTRGSSASPAARATASPSLDPNARRPARARVRPRALLRRAAAPVRARRRAPERRARASSPRRSASRRSRPATSHAHHPRRAALQDVLVAIRCRTSLDGCERERRGNHESVLLAPQEMRRPLPARPRRRRAHARARRPLRVRPDRRSSATATPTSPTAPSPPIVQLRARLRPRLRRALRAAPTATSAAARAPARRGAGADRASSASPASSSSTGRCSSSRASARSRCAAPARRAHALPPGRGRGSARRLDRLLPDRPLARRPGRGEPLARPLPQPRARRRCPTSTSTSRATSARS